MIRLSILALLVSAQSGLAEGYCGATAEQVAALPASVAGAWTGVLRGGMIVDGGKVQAIPADPEEVLDIALAAAGAGITMSEDYDFFPPMTLQPVSDAPDYALPGESPMAAAELLAPQMAEAGIACDPLTVPQFETAVPLDGTATSTLRIYALSPEAMALVITGKGEAAGQAARAVFDLSRTPAP